MAVWAWLAAALAGWAGSPLEFVGTAYRADTPFPQFAPLWSERWALEAKQGEPPPATGAAASLGAYVQLWVQNRSAAALSLLDVKLEDVSLAEAVAFSTSKTSGLLPASVHFSSLPKPAFERLAAAGEPVWWKIDPPMVPPGGFAELTIRLRHQTKAGALTVEVVGEHAAWKTRVLVRETPRFASLSFSPTLDAVYGYLLQPGQPGRSPVKLLLDGEEAAHTTFAADQALAVTPLVLRPSQPLAKASFHCFQAIYKDGSRATAAVRAWSDELVYGMWGYVNQGKTAQERVDYYLGDLQRHNVNAVMESYGSEVAAFLSGDAGLEHSSRTGIRAMRNRPGGVVNPLYYFLTDEPDAHDYAVKQLEPNQRLGALAQDLVRRSHEFRSQEPSTPHLLNLDNTFKPENWYTYAQLADVCCADPYYQEQQRIVWNERPAWAPWFLKPTYVLGAATICNSACAPKPLHIILNSVRHDIKGGPFRFATPEEKTVELFYALGAGAKGFSFWWYTPYGEFHGCGARDDAAVALWRQLGLLGAQVRTAGPLLTRGCPVTLPLKAPATLWTRTLLAGMDSLVLLVVNENVVGDRLGTAMVPLPKATVTLARPAWLEVADGFEITPEGVREAVWKNDGPQLVIDLGKTEVARMVVLTADKALRGQLGELYRNKFAATVNELLSSARSAGSQGENSK